MKGGGMVEEYDDIEAMEAKATANKLPVGWLILFWGLILWGIFYFAAYTPAISGWSQAKALEQSLENRE